jgi:hypothetical protein
MFAILFKQTITTADNSQQEKWCGCADFGCVGKIWGILRNIGTYAVRKAVLSCDQRGPQEMAEAGARHPRFPLAPSLACPAHRSEVAVHDAIACGLSCSTTAVIYTGFHQITAQLTRVR